MNTDYIHTLKREKPNLHYLQSLKTLTVQSQLCMVLHVRLVCCRLFPML